MVRLLNLILLLLESFNSCPEGGSGRQLSKTDVTLVSLIFHILTQTPILARLVGRERDLEGAGEVEERIRERPTREKEFPLIKFPLDVFSDGFIESQSFSMAQSSFSLFQRLHKQNNRTLCSSITKRD